MAQLVAAWLDPLRGSHLVVTVQGPAQIPEMLAGMIEVQYFGRARPAVLRHIPNPRGSVSHHQLGLGAAQSTAQGFPVQAPPKLQRLPLPPNHDLLIQHAASASGASGLFLPVIHAGLPFVPFHTDFLRFLLPPARPALAHLPAVQHQYGQFRGRTLGLLFLGSPFQLHLGAGFSTRAQTLGQGVQRRVGHRNTPLLGQGGGFLVRRRGGDGESQFVFQRQT